MDTRLFVLSVFEHGSSVCLLRLRCDWDDEMYLVFNRYYDMPLFHDGHNFSLLFKCFGIRNVA